MWNLWSCIIRSPGLAAPKAETVPIQCLASSQTLYPCILCVPCLPDALQSTWQSTSLMASLLLFYCKNFSDLFPRWNMVWGATCLTLFLDRGHSHSTPEETVLLPFGNERCFPSTVQSVLQRHRPCSRSHFIGNKTKLVSWQAGPLAWEAKETCLILRRALPYLRVKQ